MRPSHFIFPLALSGAALLSSCSTRPDDVLDEDALSSLLADLYVGEAYTAIEGGQYTATASLDSARKVLRQSTMQAHGVSQAQFDSTLSWYGHNLGRYSEVCEKVIDELKHRQAEAQNKEVGDDGKTDSSNLWPSQPSLRLTPAQGERTINFDIEPSAPGKGDRILWEFKTINLSSPLDAFLAVDYSDNSTGYTARTLSSAGRQSLSLQTDSTKTVKRIYGYTRVRQNEPLVLDSISLESTPFNPTHYYELSTQRTYSPARKK